MIKGILFDFNGTLFFDSDMHVKAFQEHFASVGKPVPSEEYILIEIFGRNNRTIFLEQYNANATDEEILAFSIEKEALYREVCLRDPECLRLAKGAEEFLDFLKDNHIPFNMATGAPIANVEFYFKHLGLGRWFKLEDIVYDDGSIPGKPQPDVWIEASGRIGLRPEECIVFEDSPSGIKSANAANAGAVYAITPEGQISGVTAGAIVNGEISDYTKFEDILRQHQLV